MPNGKIHDLLWQDNLPVALAATLVVGVAAWRSGAGPMDVLQIAGSVPLGYLVGRVIQPDLDLISIDRSESLAIRSVVFLPLIVWSTLYARIMQVFGGHRNFWSHCPGVSTAIRLFWFGAIPTLVLYSFGRIGPYYDYSNYVVGLWSGMTLSDTVHALADFSYTIERKVTRKFFRRFRAARRRSSAD